jgi:hypothetical protein
MNWLVAKARMCIFRGEMYFDITWVIRVFGSEEEAQASMRACKLEPFPDMRTVRLYCGADIARTYVLDYS